MSNTTWIPDGFQQLQSPKAFDQQIKLITRKVELDALPRLRFMAWAKANFKQTNNFRAPSILFDRDDAALDRTMKQWGSYTEITAQNREARRRDEMFLDFGYDACTRAEIEGLMTKDTEFRDTTQLRVDTMLRIYPKLMNDRLTQGSGALYSDAIGQHQVVDGYQTVLATTVSGTYAQVPVTANVSHQWQVTNGNAGPTGVFAADAINRVRTLLTSTIVDVNGEEMQADVLFTSLNTILTVENAMLNAGIVNIHQNASMERGGIPNSISFGTREFSFYGVPMLRDETITANRVFALCSKTWELFSAFGQLTDIVPARRMNNTVGNDVWFLIRSAFALYCRQLRPNGVLHWT